LSQKCVTLLKQWFEDKIVEFVKLTIFKEFDTRKNAQVNYAVLCF